MKKFRTLLSFITVFIVINLYALPVSADLCSSIANLGEEIVKFLEPIINFDPQHLQPTNKKQLPNETTAYFNTTPTDGQITSSYFLYTDTTVDIHIKDASGKIIATLASNEVKTRGTYTITWDGKDQTGNVAPSGAYTIIVADSTTPEQNYHIERIKLDDTPPIANLNGLFMEDIDGNGTNEVVIYGTASDSNLANYEILYNPDVLSDNWQSYIFDGQNQAGNGIVNGVLAALSLPAPTATKYAVRLIVTDRAGNTTETSITGRVLDDTSNALEITITNTTLSESLGTLNTAAYPDKPDVWIEDTLPAGVETPVNGWSWNTTTKWSGSASHTHAGGPGTNYHYFIHPDKPLIIGEKTAFNVNIIQYVYLDPLDPPEQILLQFYTGVGDGERRVYWGENLINLEGVDGTASSLRMGNLPPAGKWVRLKIPVDVLNLNGKAIKGMTYAAHGGKVFWDKTTTSSDFVEFQEGSYEVMIQGEDNSSPATINYRLSKAATISLKIFDSAGVLVRTLIDNLSIPAGSNEILWDNRDDSGAPVPSGRYAFQFSTTDGAIDSDSILKYSTLLNSTNLPGMDPSSLSLDSQRNIYVINNTDNKVYKFGPDGSVLHSVTPADTPAAISVDSTGSLYILNSVNLAISKYDSGGTWILDIPSNATNPGTPLPMDLAVGPGDKLFAMDSLSSFQIYQSDGTLLSSINVAQDDPLTPEVEGPDFLPTLMAIGVDYLGSIYLLDSTQNSVLEYSSSSVFVRSLQLPKENGSALTGPSDLVFDANGNLYVSYPGEHVVKKVNRNGSLLAVFGAGLSAPSWIAMDKMGHLSISDSVRKTVDRFNVARGEIELGNISARIISPVHESLVAGGVAIQGTASAKDFQRYTVEWGWGEDPVAWNPLIESYTEMDNEFKFEEHAAQTVGDELAVFDINGILNGIWDSNTYNSFGVTTVRLTVYTNDGRSAEDRVTVTWGGVVLTTSSATIVSSDKKVNFTIPAHGVNTIGGLVVSIAPSHDPKIETLKYKKIGEFYEFRPPGLPFVKPATIEMSYSLSDIDFDGDGIADVDETKLAIYQWDPSIQDWKYLGGKVNMVDRSVVANVHEVSYGEAYYVIFADLIKILPPVIYQPASPTDQEVITLFGVSEPGSTVEIYVDDLFQGYALADGTTGDFRIDGVRLKPGVNLINGQARDAMDDWSDKSVPVSVRYNPALPVTVSTLQFMTPDYSAPQTGDVRIGEGLYVELIGSDNNPDRIDTVSIHVAGSFTDTSGFDLQLIETSLDTGVYRGPFNTGHETRIGSAIIAVIPGESLTISSLDDPSVTRSIRILDDLPPSRPLVTSTTHPSLAQSYFEGDFGELANRSGTPGGTVLLDNIAPFSGDYSAIVFNEVEGGDMGVVLRSSPYNAREYPVVSFAYKIGSDVKTNIMVSVEDVWYEIVFTDEPKHVEDFERVLYTSIGDLNIQTDGAWHEVEFNLYTMLKNLMPDKSDFIVDEMIMAEWDNTQWSVVETGGNNPAGAHYALDNFMISGRRAGNQVVLNWPGLTDGSGILGYSYLLDNLSDSVPDTIIDSVEPQALFSNLTDGTYFFHVTAGDGAGNWSQTAHYRFKVDTEGPAAFSPVPGINESSSLSEISLKVVDGYGSGIDIDSIRIEVEGRVYDFTSKGITYDPVSETMDLKFWKILPTPPPIMDAQVVDVVLLEARDLAGNPLTESFAWSWVADYSSFAQGSMTLLTTGGGSSPSWSPDGSKIAFVSKRDGNEQLYVIDSNDFIEAKNSLIKLTDTLTGVRNYAPSWSPAPGDGRILFVSDRDGSDDIWMVHADGTGLTKLTLDDYSGVYKDRDPSWSSDGSSVLFSRDGAIREMNPDGAGSVKLARDGIFRYVEPQKSGNGEKIVFTKALYENHIWLMNADGSGEIQLTGTNQNRSPSWMPNNQEILYENNSEIWKARIDGTKDSVFVDNGGKWKDGHPRWTPVPGDSRVAFQSTRNGAWNIWIMSALEVSGVSVTPEVFSPNGDGVNDTTAITFNPSASNIVMDLTILDSLNNPVRTLVNGEAGLQGSQTVIWDALDNAGLVVNDGPYQFELVIASLSGQSRIVKRGNILVDTTPPVTTVSFSNPYLKNGTNSYGTDTTQIGFDSRDGSGSGVAGTEYSLDNGLNWFPYEGLFSLTTPGANTFWFRSFDRAGNVEVIQEARLFVDSEAPVSSMPEMAALYTNGTNYFAPAGQTITMAASDTGSGVGDLFIKPQGNADFISYSRPISLNSSGFNIIQYYSVDNVGNSEGLKSVNIMVDDQLPLTSIVPGAGVFFNGMKHYALISDQYEIVGSDSSSGVSGVDVSVDNGTFVPYTAPVSFNTLGFHTLSARSIDNVGNVGPVTSFNVEVVDLLPTTSMISGSNLYGASNHAPPGYLLELVSQTTGIEVNINGAGFVPYTAPISFTVEGLYTIDYRGIRANGTYEPLTTFNLSIDGAAPQTTIDLGLPLFGSNPAYITSENLISLNSTDSSSGVARIEYAINTTSAWTLYEGPFKLLSEGDAAISFRAIDNVGNVETMQVFNTVVDNTSPVVDPITASGQLYNDGALTFSPAGFTYTITANDALSGLSGVEFMVDNGSYQPYIAPFTLSPGVHNVLYRGKDNLGHTSLERTFTVNVDGASPVSTVRMDRPFYGAGLVYISNRTNIYIISSDGRGSGINNIQYRMDGETIWTDYTVPFKVSGLAQKTLHYRGLDFVGNQEMEKSIVLIPDRTPPSTTHSFTGGYVGTFPVSIKPETTILLAGVDANGSGIKETEYKIDAGSWTRYTGEFAISFPGRHTLYYRSLDNLGNGETIKNLPVRVDVEPPVTIVAANNSTLCSDGEKSCALLTQNSFTLSATDADAGVDFTEINVDGSGYSPYTAPVTFISVGSHIIRYRSTDLLGNVETEKEYRIEIVETMPLLRIETNEPVYHDTAGTRYTSGVTNFTLISNELTPPDSIEYQIDNGSYLTYATGFSVPAEGPRVISYRGVINGIPDTASSYPVTIDNTPPVTTLNIGTPAFNSNGVVYITTNTPVSLISTDSLSGVAGTFYSTDGGANRVRYNGLPFTLNSAGTIELTYYSEDNVGNSETPVTKTLIVDATPPVVSLTPSGVIAVNRGNNSAPSTYHYSLSVTDKESGVDRMEVNVDGSGYVVSTAPVSFNSGGLHQIQYKGVNNLGMWSQVKSFAVVVRDTTLSAEIVPSETPLVISSEKVVSGKCTFSLRVKYNPELLDYIEYRVDGGKYQPFSAPVGPFGNGIHVIEYRAVDRLGNGEAVKSYTFKTDNTPPEILNLTALPNPFTPNSELNVGVDDETRISMNVKDTNPGSVILSVDILDNMGNRIRSLVDRIQVNGGYFVNWDGKDDFGNYVPEGEYIYKVYAEDMFGNKADGTGAVASIRSVLEKRITSDLNEQINPDIYGETAVWQDNRNGNWDIYLYDYKTGSELQVTHDGNNQTNPAISGNTVVWQDDRNGNSDIYLYSIKTGLETRLTTDLSDQTLPSIEGNNIVWVDNRNGNSDIYLYDFTLGSGSIVTNNTADQVNPSVYGNVVVWEDYRNGNADIYAWDILRGEEIQITNDPFDQINPAVYGGKVVWEDQRSADSDIFIYDLASGIETQLTVSPANQTNPVIYGNLIAYVDDSSGGLDKDVYFYNIISGYKFHATTNIATQENPALYENRVIYQDNRNGNWDIYGATAASMVTNVQQDNVTFDSTDQTESALYADRMSYTQASNGGSGIYWQDLSTGVVTPVANLANVKHSHSDIFGDVVVWQDDRNGNLDIYRYDLNLGVETRVTTDLRNQQNPSVYGDFIVWQDDRNGNWDVYLYDLKTGVENPVTNSFADQINPVIFGSTVVWQDNRNGTWDIYEYDLNTLTEKRLSLGGADYLEPDIFNDVVVWVRTGDRAEIQIYNRNTGIIDTIDAGLANSRNPSLYGDSVVFEVSGGIDEGLYLYRISDQKLIFIATGAAGNRLPVIFGKRIIWQGFENGEWNIYSGTLSFIIPVDNEPPGVEALNISEPTISPDSSPGVKDSVEIRFQLTDNLSEKLRTRVQVFDSGQNVVRTLIDADMPIGSTLVPWDGKNGQGMLVSDGVYTITIFVTDDASLAATPRSVQITVDNTAPVVTITGVIEGGVYTGPVTPLITIAEAHPDLSQVTLNDLPFVSGTSVTAPGRYSLTVNAKDRGGNEVIQSVSFKSASLVVNLYAGLNLVSFPVPFVEPYDSYNLLTRLGENAASVQRLNPETASFETTSWVHGQPAGARFPVLSGEGYFVYMYQSRAEGFVHSVSCAPIDLKKGLNMVRLPCAPPGFTSYDFLEKFGPDFVEDIQRIDAQNGIVQKSFYASGTLAGPVFPIKDQEGYLIYTREDIKGFRLR